MAQRARGAVGWWVAVLVGWLVTVFSTPPSSVSSSPVSSSPVSSSLGPAATVPSIPTIPGASFFGWALLDRRTGAESGSVNASTGTNTAESMIKPWIAADYLRRLAEAGQQPTAQALHELTLMIVDSNDRLAEKYYQLGGADKTIIRLSAVCGLTRVSPVPGTWSATEITPHDAVRYGLCLADGRAAGPQWTTWILDTMRNVRGGVNDQVDETVQGGRWGIVDGLPPELASRTSMKNGWTLHQNGWHVNCLAVNSDWVLTIMMRRDGGLRAAADGCAAVTTQVLAETGH